MECHRLRPCFSDEASAALELESFQTSSNIRKIRVESRYVQVSKRFLRIVWSCPLLKSPMTAPHFFQTNLIALPCLLLSPARRLVLVRAEHLRHLLHVTSTILQCPLLCMLTASHCRKNNDSTLLRDKRVSFFWHSKTCFF